jgi:adenosine deaminase
MPDPSEKQPPKLVAFARLAADAGMVVTQRFRPADILRVRRSRFWACLGSGILHRWSSTMVELVQPLRDSSHCIFAQRQTLETVAIAFIALFSLSLPSFAFQPVQVSPGSPVQRSFERAQSDPVALRAFLQRMPKGADLHLHISGAVYAESFLAQAAQDNLCVELATLTVIQNVGTTRSIPPKPVCPVASVAADSAFRDQKLYDKLVNAFSMRSFVPLAGTSGHDQFFATFDRFVKIDPQKHLGEWLNEVSRRAADQNEQYLEIMHTPDFATAAKLGYEVGWSGNLAETRTALLSRGLGENVKRDREELDRAERERDRLQGCSPGLSDGPCRVRIRYLFQVLRGFAPEQVFAQTLLGFELASVDPRVVGINFVMAEDWYIPMREYHRQMEMLNYLHSVYPKVHISLHAGELAPGLVPPEGLKFHVREAIELGHAERIGHGVDIVYEHDQRQLLTEMASKRIAVEVNLTSNDVILGVKGSAHPLPLYRAAGVPVALCTDDEGVSRIDLTHEYVRAASEFGLSYFDLKNIARSSLEFSFLAGSSLWTSPGGYTRQQAACAADPPNENGSPSKACASFLQANEKAKEQWELERRFRVFEAQAR